MRRWNLNRYAISSCVTAALLAGCGGSQPPIGAPSAIQQTSAISPARTGLHKPLTTAYFKSLYAFGAQSGDGEYPQAGLLNVNGALYGTTSAGGRSHFRDGTVFSITTGGTEQVLYSFKDRKRRRHGYVPAAALIFMNGLLYGTAEAGGKYGTGAAFQLSTTGVEHVIHSFGKSSDGAFPNSRLLNANGTFYGTTLLGGNYACGYGCGAVFSLTPSGSEHVLYRFESEPDGHRPFAGLTDVNGTLYGTTESGGTYQEGTIFSISTSGSEQVLHSFGNGSDGTDPRSDLIDVNGTLYGTTVSGGTHSGGTIFSISTSGSEQVLYNFGSGYDGQGPVAGLIEMNGTLYGTTEFGGTYGDGTVFSVSTSGSEAVLHSFSGSDGQNPVGDLIALGGTLYGTTKLGGDAAGTVFALTP
jgi:uncharacterized repeat protein (TIGR03803 family)